MRHLRTILETSWFSVASACRSHTGHGPAWLGIVSGLAMQTISKNDFEKRFRVRKILKNTRQKMCWRNDFEKRVWGRKDIGKMLGKIELENRL